MNNKLASFTLLEEKRMKKSVKHEIVEKKNEKRFIF